MGKHFWDEYESCTQQGIIITVTKVKSHAKEEHQVPIAMKQGNDVADHHAVLGVRECPTGEANRIRNLDSKARWFQERMVQALMLLPKRGRHPHERAHRMNRHRSKYHTIAKGMLEQGC